ncbi:MAG: hypothetical protein WA139_01610 [Candidatus Aenigmatarchaeota archaeon]
MVNELDAIELCPVSKGGISDAFKKGYSVEEIKTAITNGLNHYANYGGAAARIAKTLLSTLDKNGLEIYQRNSPIP